MKKYLLLLIISLYSCSNYEATVEKKHEPFCLSADFKSSLKFVEAKQEDVVDHIHLMGTVTTNPEAVLNYVSLVKGVLSGVYFSLGDNVKKGQLLAELRSPELSALQSQLAGIDAQILTAERNTDAVKSMHNDKLASDKDLQEALMHLKMLRSEKQKAIADLKLYGGNNARGVFQIFAPSSGTITAKNINTGMQISDETGTLFTIASLDNVWLMANVYVGNLQSVEVGMDVEIQTLAYPDEILHGKISTLTPVIDENEKVLKARIELTNPGHKLKPGMVADVNTIKKTRIKAIAIPATAVVFDDNAHFVVVYKDDCHLSVRKLEILSKNSDVVYCKSGVDAGEIIIANNSLMLYEQLKNFENY